MIPDVHQKMERHINFIRHLRTGFSKKQWVITAILEKLEIEERKSREFLENLQMQSAVAAKKG